MKKQELMNRLIDDHTNIRNQVDEILGALEEITNQLTCLDEDIQYVDDVED